MLKKNYCIHILKTHKIIPIFILGITHLCILSNTQQAVVVGYQELTISKILRHWNIPIKGRLQIKKNKNNSDAYEELAKLVKNASNYQQISGLNIWGDEQIDLKSKGENNGNAPSFWISVRANLYMTILCFRVNSSLVLDL